MPACTAGCTASCHARLERPQGDTLVDVLERGYRVVACRGKRLAAVVVLSRPEACRSPGLAGTLSPWLEHFVLEWLQGNLGGSWRSPSKPCRGVLQLPVHKFGVLGYPYSSTPTGAPGPGPDTVPSAVGPGPRQGTGTRGLGHAESRSVSTALSHNGTR